MRKGNLQTFSGIVVDTSAHKYGNAQFCRPYSSSGMPWQSTRAQIQRFQAWSCIKDTSGEITKATGAQPHTLGLIRMPIGNQRVHCLLRFCLTKFEANMVQFFFYFASPRLQFGVLSPGPGPWPPCVWRQWRSTNAGSMKQPLLPARHASGPIQCS